MPAVSLRGGDQTSDRGSRRIFSEAAVRILAWVWRLRSLGGRWVIYGNLNGVVPTGTHRRFRPIAYASWACRHRIPLVGEPIAHGPVDYYSSPFPGLGSDVFDKGVTESVVGFSYRVAQHFLWQVYAVENLDFITGSAADFTSQQY